MRCEDLETKLEEIVLVVGFATTRPECVSASPATAAHFATDRYYIHTYPAAPFFIQALSYLLPLVDVFGSLIYRRVLSE